MMWQARRAVVFRDWSGGRWARNAKVDRRQLPKIGGSTGASDAWRGS